MVVGVLARSGGRAVRTPGLRTLEDGEHGLGAVLVVGRDHVLGHHLLAVVELHPLADLEHPGLGIGRRAPFGGEPGLQLAGGRQPHQPAVLVGQAHREAVDLGLHRVGVIGALEQLPEADMERAQLLLVVGVVEAQHFLPVRHFDESLDAIITHALRRRIATGELRKPRLQISQLVLQHVILKVRDFGLRVSVIKLVVPRDLRTQFGDQRSFADQMPGYRRAKLVLFTGATTTGCGYGDAATGPFYCPLDERVYIDLSFYDELAQRFGAPGDFAEAYVIAHEIGHHVQHQLGTDDKVPKGRTALGASGASVRLELQADCYAGVWAASAARRNLLDVGDLDAAYGLAKYEPPVKPLGTDCVRELPSFPRYYKLGHLAENPYMFHAGDRVQVTEKIHGTNFRVGIVDGVQVAGSHNTQRVVGPHSLYSMPLQHNGVVKMLEAIGGNAVLYGEIYGAGIQDMRYGMEYPTWRAFDIAVDGQWLSVQNKNELWDYYNIPSVPVLYAGLWDHELIMGLVDGPTTLCPTEAIREPFKGREGIVITAYGTIRKIARAVSADYHARANKDQTEEH